MTLFHRGVVQEARCPICENDVETAELILWNCPEAQDVWSCGPKRIQKCSATGSTFPKIVESLMERCEVEDVEWAVMVARKIWFRRNEVVHGGELLHPSKPLTEACNCLNEFRRVNSKEHDVQNGPHASTPINWKKKKKRHAQVCLKVIGMQLLIRPSDALG